MGLDRAIEDQLLMDQIYATVVDPPELPRLADPVHGG
jgi:hypothetical protein